MERDVNTKEIQSRTDSKEKVEDWYWDMKYWDGMRLHHETFY